ncbi:MAG: DUF389 domain-containing protein [Solirubrobacterales bacterium]|nr:DUF389 domain-containing protein [Solirubrobacterales bacterium]
MLRLRAEAPGESGDRLVTELGKLKGVRRITAADGLTGSYRVVEADVNSGSADRVLRVLRGVGLGHDDYVLVREDVVTRSAPGERAGEDYSWVEIIGEARANSRPVARYVILMMVAGWIAGLGVITGSQILIIGAMAVSPDLLPLCATCIGVAGRRYRLAGQSLATLTIGMALVAAVALVVAAGLQATGLLASDASLHQGVIGALAHADYSTVMIALAAGVAAILTFETRTATAVGVAISVTTVPASAYFGVALAFGDQGRAWSALLVLGINLICLVVAGTLTIALQRRFTPDR